LQTGRQCQSRDFDATANFLINIPDISIESWNYQLKSQNYMIA